MHMHLSASMHVTPPPNPLRRPLVLIRACDQSREGVVQALDFPIELGKALVRVCVVGRYQVHERPGLRGSARRTGRLRASSTRQVSAKLVGPCMRASLTAGRVRGSHKLWVAPALGLR
jgi:hypothetical protein